jgi:hypothetical protein
MRRADLPSRLPENGLDLAPVRQYVDALENPAYPLIEDRWPNHHTARIDAVLTPSQIVSFQMTWWPGWRATANGRPITVRKDRFGFLYLEPNCSGPCAIEMTWDGGMELLLLRWLQVVAVAGGLPWLALAHRRQRRTG